MNSLEDCWPPYLNEWNFRVIIKSHLLNILRYRNIYLRKRHIVNCTRLGDECTKSFHAMATISYKKNVITQLTDGIGNLISDHDSKASIIWTSFKNRMRVSSKPVMRADLSDRIDP